MYCYSIPVSSTVLLVQVVFEQRAVYSNTVYNNATQVADRTEHTQHTRTVRVCIMCHRFNVGTCMLQVYTARYYKKYQYCSFPFKKYFSYYRYYYSTIQYSILSYCTENNTVVVQIISVPDIDHDKVLLITSTT